MIKRINKDWVEVETVDECEILKHLVNINRVTTIYEREDGSAVINFESSSFSPKETYKEIVEFLREPDESNPFLGVE